MIQRVGASSAFLDSVSRFSAPQFSDFRLQRFPVGCHFSCFFFKKNKFSWPELRTCGSSYALRRTNVTVLRTGGSLPFAPHTCYGHAEDRSGNEAISRAVPHPFAHWNQRVTLQNGLRGGKTINTAKSIWVVRRHGGVLAWNSGISPQRLGALRTPGSVERVDGGISTHTQ